MDLSTLKVGDTVTLRSNLVLQVQKITTMPQGSYPYRVQYNNTDLAPMDYTKRGTFWSNGANAPHDIISFEHKQEPSCDIDLSKLKVGDEVRTRSAGVLKVSHKPQYAQDSPYPWTIQLGEVCNTYCSNGHVHLHNIEVSHDIMEIVETSNSNLEHYIGFIGLTNNSQHKIVGVSDDHDEMQTLTLQDIKSKQICYRNFTNKHELISWLTIMRFAPEEKGNTLHILDETTPYDKIEQQIKNHVGFVSEQPRPTKLKATDVGSAVEDLIASILK